MRAFRRPSIALLVLVNLWPTLAFGQATKAGVVSTLQGTVTASRATAPQQPVPLKVKDDVFLQDRIVAEVSQSTAQVGAGAPRTLSNFYVLRDLTNRGIQVTQLATGATANLLAGQGFSILGAAAGRNVPIPPNVSAGLSTPAGAQHATGSTEATSNV